MTVLWSFTRQAFHSTAVYRIDFFLQLFSSFMMMYGTYWVWTTLYEKTPGAFGVSLEQMITYGALGMALESVLAPGRGPQYYISSKLRTGDIDTDLTKPIDFHLHMLAKTFGETAFRFVTLVLPSVLLARLFLNFQLPYSTVNFVWFSVSLLLAFFVLFSLNFLLGMLAVITIDIRNLTWAYNSLVRFFAGQMIPLWLFPGWLKIISDWLPFKSIYFVPLSLYIGRLEGAEAIQSLAIQVVWGVVLLLLSRVVWNNVHAKLVVQGG